METSDAMAAKFRISKREKGEFKYTGVDVKREENGDIVINQEAYKETLHEIEVEDKEGVYDEIIEGEKFETVKVETIVNDTIEGNEGEKSDDRNETKVVEKQGVNNEDIEGEKI